MDNYSAHAARRAAQRGIGDEAVDAALRWGRAIPQEDGRTAYFLGVREAAQAAAAGEDVDRFRGTAVVEARDGAIVTVVSTATSERLRRHSRGAARHGRRPRRASAPRRGAP